MYHFTAVVTCLAIAFYLFTSLEVSRARTRYGVELPAISGNVDFERVYRIYGPSFRVGPKDQTRNLEIPGSMLRVAPE